MTETGTALIRRESDAARRLARLFKIERDGRFDRLPVATVKLLIDRRGALVKDLQVLDEMRRSLDVPHWPELERALAELMREVNRALYTARTRVEQIGGDLRVRRGEGLLTGIRNSGNGHLLGKT